MANRVITISTTGPRPYKLPQGVQNAHTGFASGQWPDGALVATKTQGDKADTAIQSVVAGSNIIINNTDPRNPIISSTGGGGGGSGGDGVPLTRVVNAGTGLTGGGELASDIIISLSPATIASLGLADTAIQGSDSRLTDARTPTAHTHIATEISDSTATGRSLLTAANAAAAQSAISVPPTTRTVSAGTGLTGGGDLSDNRTLSLSAGSISSLALADTAVQPARSVSAGTGLSGGGDLTANRTLSLSAGSIASLALADTAVQPARQISTGTGLTGGGSLAADRTLALDSASIASLALANTALQGLTAGTNISINNTDPKNPIISATGGGGSSVPDQKLIVQPTGPMATSDIVVTGPVGGLVEITLSNLSNVSDVYIAFNKWEIDWEEDPLPVFQSLWVTFEEDFTDRPPINLWVDAVSPVGRWWILDLYTYDGPPNQSGEMWERIPIQQMSPPFENGLALFGFRIFSQGIPSWTPGEIRPPQVTTIGTVDISTHRPIEPITINPGTSLYHPSLPYYVSYEEGYSNIHVALSNKSAGFSSFIVPISVEAGFVDINITVDITNGPGHFMFAVGGGQNEEHPPITINMDGPSTAPLEIPPGVLAADGSDYFIIHCFRYDSRTQISCLNLPKVSIAAGSPAVQIWTGIAADAPALEERDPNTLYFITE